MKRLLNASILFKRPAITLGFPAKSASKPIEATSAGGSMVDFTELGVRKPDTSLKPVSIKPGDNTVTPTLGASSTLSASPNDDTYAFAAA